MTQDLATALLANVFCGYVLVIMSHPGVMIRSGQFSVGDTEISRITRQCRECKCDAVIMRPWRVLVGLHGSHHPWYSLDVE